MLDAIVKWVTIALFAVPALASIDTTIDLGGGYIAYDCGAFGSAAFQACQNAMTLGESDFLASYIPSGSSLPSEWLALLPPLPLQTGGYWRVSADSPDGLSSLITENEDGDNLTSYVWNAGSFAPTWPETLSGGTHPVAYINDQGTIAGSGDCFLFLAPLLGSGPLLPCRPLNPFPRPRLTLNDENQLLAVGVNMQCLAGSTAACLETSSDSVLIDPPGAPIPGVPEPSTRILLASVLIAIIPRIRKGSCHG